MTKTSFAKKAIVMAIGMFGMTTAYAADTAITNGTTLSAVITDKGNFAGQNDVGSGGLPTGGTPGLTWTGTEFVNIDNASSWWRLDTSAGSYTAHYDTGSSTLVGSTSTAAAGSEIATTGTISGTSTLLGFRQTVSIVSDSQLSVAVTFTNLSGAAVSGLQYSVGFDPDQAGSGLNATENMILSQGALAGVRAWDTLYSTSSWKAITLSDTTGTGGPSTRAMIAIGNCCGSVAPSTILGTAQGANFTANGDYGIMLAYDLGTLAASGVGSSVTFGYAYTFTTPVPEPEIYAMMAAGLGLMGFVARRRKKFEDAVV